MGSSIYGSKMLSYALTIIFEILLAFKYYCDIFSDFFNWVQLILVILEWKYDILY